MYKYKVGVSYPVDKSKRWTAGGYPSKIKNLHKHRLYFNTKQFVDMEFTNIFVDYDVTTAGFEKDLGGYISPAEDDSLWLTPKYFGYWIAQLGFAIYCASTCLGISAEHLMRGSGMLKAIYRFHVYYHVRRVLHMMEVKLPGESGFSRFKNSYSGEGYNKACLEYGADSTVKYGPHRSYLYWDKDGYSFYTANELIMRWIIDVGRGLTFKALGMISESVREYCYLMITSQVGVRRSIYDSNAQRNYIELLETVIEKPVNLAADVARYEKLLKYAKTKVEFPVAYGAYMLPSNMLAKSGDVKNYNYSTKVATNDMVIGEINGHVNLPKPIHINPPTPKPIHINPPTPKPKHINLPTHKPNHINPPTPKPTPNPTPKPEDIEHEEEKVAIILIGSMVAGVIYLFR